MNVGSILGTSNACMMALGITSGQTFDGTDPINFTTFQLPRGSATLPQTLLSTDPTSQYNKIQGFTVGSIQWAPFAYAPPSIGFVGGVSYSSYGGLLRISLDVLNQGKAANWSFPVTLLVNTATSVIQSCYISFSSEAVCTHSGGVQDPSSGICIQTFFNNINTNNLAYNCDLSACGANAGHVRFDSSAQPICSCVTRP